MNVPEGNFDRVILQTFCTLYSSKRKLTYLTLTTNFNQQFRPNSWRKRFASNVELSNWFGGLCTLTSSTASVV